MAVRHQHALLHKAAPAPLNDENINLSKMDYGKNAAKSAAAAAALADKSAKAALAPAAATKRQAALSESQKAILAEKYNELFEAIDAKYAQLVERGIEDGEEYAELEKEIALAVEKLEDLRRTLQERREVEVEEARCPPPRARQTSTTSPVVENRELGRKSLSAEDLRLAKEQKQYWQSLRCKVSSEGATGDRPAERQPATCSRAAERLRSQLQQSGCPVLCTSSPDAELGLVPPLTGADGMPGDEVYSACKSNASDARLRSSASCVLAGSILQASGTLAQAWDETVAAYCSQIRGLVDGGADIIFLDSFADVLHVKAAGVALHQAAEAAGGGELPPVMISTVVGADLRTRPHSQSVDAFCISIQHLQPLAVGVNLVEGSVRRLAERCPASAFCFADLRGTDGLGLAELSGSADFVCVEPSSVPELRGVLRSFVVRTPAQVADELSGPSTRLSARDAHSFPVEQLMMIGQRSNATYCRKFAEAVECEDWTAAMEVCRLQCQLGADVLELNVDSCPRPAKAMATLVDLCAADPEVGKVPLVIGSADWPVIEAGLRRCPGRCVANALCMSTGEDEFTRLARLCHQYGASVIAMAMGKAGAAKTAVEKVQQCRACYDILCRLGFEPEEIFLDAAVLPIGTSSSKSNGHSFLSALADLKKTCPGARLTGGVSIISSLFKGLGQGVLRRTLHAVFLNHCIRQGLSAGFVDAGSVPCYSDVNPALRDLCEEVIWDSSLDGQHLVRFLSLVSKGPVKGSGPAMQPGSEVVQPMPLVRGNLRTIIHASLSPYSPFSLFGAKAHASFTAHRMQHNLDMLSSIFFSSISVWLGQSGQMLGTAASSVLDGMAMWQNHQQLGHKSVTIQWGPIGDIGLRRQLFGSRDVFETAGVDLGQKLINASDTKMIMRVVLLSVGIPVGPVAYETEEERVRRQYGSGRKAIAGR
mmetsp:Transcript_52366/g.125045  ORF Transcript_52366/g.125045 Transcript_52366/m.125045 type:complete len:935 (+) Transcript_52366:68-2872(+)